MFSTSPVLTTPNIGVANGTSLVLSGNLTAKHIIGVAGTPGVAWGTGAGTAPTGTAIAGKDIGGSITFTTSTGTVGGAVIATITFNVAYGNAPSSIVLSAGSNQAGFVPRSQASPSRWRLRQPHQIRFGWSTKAAVLREG